MTSDRWSDLKARVLSSIVMVIIAGFGVVIGGGVFATLITVMVAVMHWELGGMLSPLSRQARWLSAFVAIVAMIIIPMLTTKVSILVAFGFVAGFAYWFYMSHARLGALYSVMIVLSGVFLINLRNDLGLYAILWLIGLVVATDIAGYFAGRILGGPKFWPRFSPKKTWSGAIAGWVGAAGVTVLLAGEVGLQFAQTTLIVLAIAMSFASQMGDIFESAIKRMSSVKDSSNLIPGHGGVLDRFDGIVGAALAFGFITFWIL